MCSCITLDQWTLGYSGLLATGGLIGYLKAGSVPSLVAGAGSGALVAAVNYWQMPYKTVATTVVASALGYIMGKKFMNTNKFMPAGLIAVTSFVTVVAHLNRLYNNGPR